LHNSTAYVLSLIPLYAYTLTTQYARYGIYQHHKELTSFYIFMYIYAIPGS